MRKLKMLLVAGAVALVALAAMSATASAFRYAISRAGAIASPSLGTLVFEGGATVTCNVTFNGSLMSTATIVGFNRIGDITEVRTANCSGGSIRSFLVGSGARSWPITLSGVPVGLPNEATVLELRFSGMSLNFSVFGGFVECLYRGELIVAYALNTTRGSGVYTSAALATISPNTFSFVSGSGLCPRGGSFRGTLLGFSPTQTLTVS